jgi:HPt (histidine-containing phosphotransfer) domain-containing protein
MPGLDGFAATRRWRQQEQGARLTIVALTANAMAGDRERCLDAGMDDYLAKPFTGEQLLAVMRRWLPEERRKPAPGRTATPAPTLVAKAAVTEALGPLDPAALDKLRALSPQGADQLIRQLFEAYLRGARPLLTQLAGAQAAGDGTALAGIGHALKSSSFNVGANRLAECCRQLESLARTGDADLASLCEQLQEEWLRVEAAILKTLEKA